jgi:hypothetical protein
MNEPTRTQPGWGIPPSQHTPPRRRGRGPTVTLFAILGALLGMIAPSFLYAVVTGQPSPFGALAMLAGAMLGLVAGIWFGVRTRR